MFSLLFLNKAIYWIYLMKICKSSFQKCTFQQTLFPKKSFHLNLHVSFRAFFFHKSVVIAKKTPAKYLQQEWDSSVTVNSWITPSIFKILFILTVSILEILHYILRIPISCGYRPVFQICSDFWLKFLLYITLKHRPILLKIWHRNSKSSNTVACLSVSTVSQWSPAQL